VTNHNVGVEILFSEDEIEQEKVDENLNSQCVEILYDLMDEPGKHGASVYCKVNIVVLPLVVWLVKCLVGQFDLLESGKVLAVKKQIFCKMHKPCQLQIQ
jgi:hypothetical protein